MVQIFSISVFRKETQSKVLK